MAPGDPWLSVVMPVFNGERYLEQALESVRAEGAAGCEVVAIDDGSSDRSPEILRAWERRLPLRILRGRGGNWVAATNAGLREARGEYACFLHQDDLWLPGRLAALRREAESGPALILHPALFVGPDGGRLGTWRCPLPEGEVEARLLVERLLVQNFIAAPAPAFARKAVLRVSGMDESLWYTADWDLWLKLARQGPIRHVGSALAAFRVHGESQTVRRREPGDRRRQLETVLERHSGGAPSDVRRAARFSLELNLALAAGANGSPFPWRALLQAFSRLGPASGARYLRDSRIVERIRARLRVRGALAPG
jgi:GT2 family glycosyltransferase